MIQTQYPSQLLERAVHEFATLPGIGRKTALRLVLHLLRQDDEDVMRFTETIARMKQEVRHCRVCHNISDDETCPICSDPRRDASIICVVENIQDVMAVENTQQFNGLYHVLGGVISPMDGMGPADIEIDSLIQRVGEGTVQEVILALSPTMEGDTTNFYIYRRIQNLNAQPSTFNPQLSDLRISQIARGVAIGNELEYTDEITLGRSIVNRTDFTA